MRIITAVSLDKARHSGEAVCLSKYEHCVHVHRTEERNANKTSVYTLSSFFSTLAAALQWTLPKKNPQDADHCASLNTVMRLFIHVYGLLICWAGQQAST
jgi:hypothetical protein